MTRVKTTEREFTGQVIFWLNEAISQGSYPFERASSEASLKVSSTETNFPDIQVWLNREAGMCFCGWELKTPSTPADDEDLLEGAATKARAMNADYFVTWNMRDAIIWRTPNRIERVTREHRSKTYRPIVVVTNAEDLRVASKRELLRGRAREILHDLSILHRVGHLHLVDVDSTFFVHILSEAVKTLRPLINESLASKIGRDKKFKESLFDWAVRQGIANYGDPVFFEIVSRQVAYRLLGKVLFYFTLQRFRADLPAMNLKGIDPATISEKLQEYFESARRIDYQAVFEEDFTDTIPIPPSAIDVLTTLIVDLNRFNFSNMPQDVVGNVFEGLIPPEERHILGQYFTKEELVDLINAFCIQRLNSKVIDPTCGTGTFLIRAYDRLKNFGERAHASLLSNLWGFDVAHFPAELATINLFRQDISNYANFPRIVTKDFFDVKPGDAFKFPPPKPTVDTDFMMEENLPVFDAVVGNFPFIRQELIEKRVPGYKEILARVLTQGQMKEDPNSEGCVKLSGQADIYAYLFFHTARFLKKDGGRMGIVTSNSWLDVAYGYELQRFFLKNFKIVAILESRCEPWFEESAVNTVVTILERIPLDDKVIEDRDEHLVKFVKIKKRLKELAPWDMKLEAMRRWGGLDKLVHTIESAGSEHFKLRGTKFENTLKGVNTREDDDLRIRVIRQGELLENLESAAKTAKWGQYLRAPDVYFEIFKKCEGKLVSLKRLAEVRFGIKPGITKFFFLTKNTIEHWKIEDEFLAPIIRTPKEALGCAIDAENLEFKMLLCRDDIRKLKRYKGLSSYVHWGEKQKTENGTPWPEVPSVRGRKYWYDLGEREIADGLWPEMYFDSYRILLNTARVFESDKFYGVTALNRKDAKLLIAILNSSIIHIQRELCGFHSLGEGVLKMAVHEVEDLLIPQLAEIKADIRSAIIKTFDKLLARQIQCVSEEVKMKDRQKLDILVLEAIGLDPKKYLKTIYDGLCELVRERVELAQMRKTIKKAKTQKDVEKVVVEVVNEVIPDGLRPFPEEFIDSRYLKDAKEISVPNEALKLGFYFMGLQDVITEGGFKYQASSIEEAKFIIYSQRPNSYIAKLPKDKIRIMKAVDEYARYLKGLKDKLFEAFFTRTYDHKLADTLAARVMHEAGAKEI